MENRPLNAATIQRKNELIDFIAKIIGTTNVQLIHQLLNNKLNANPDDLEDSSLALIRHQKFYSVLFQEKLWLKRESALDQLDLEN